jgi:uncharacterized protein (DUF305 family)
MNWRRFLIGILALVVMGGVVGLATADNAIEGRVGRAEVRFMEGMIDHHQMAIDMANDCLSKATTEAVTALCQNIINAQTGEIETLQGWLLDWYNTQYAPVSMMDTESTESGEMAGMDHSAMETEEAPMTDPAMTMGMMAGLGHLEGVEYEIAFLEAMVDHHDDAIHMSERILERAPEGVGHSELRGMAQTIIDDQTREIEEMEALIVELGGEN